jgi:3',5'-cyclic-AMP phosphodiesterase
MFRVVQLSDCHLLRDSSAAYRGEDADGWLARVVEVCRGLKPDGVVLSGDVAEDGSVEAYQRVVEMLDGLAERIAWLPGNHDERSIMNKVFEPAGFHAGPVLDWGGWQIVLLDSAWPGHPEGHLDDERLQPLNELDDEQPALVFIHHQPLPVGAPWIDELGLMKPERLWRRLEHSPVRAVAFGHVHQVFEAERNGMACLSAPSTVANSVAGTDEFELRGDLPRARWFELKADGRWDSGLVRVE